MVTAKRERVVDAMLALEDEFGRITPDLVLEVATDPASPFHSSFTWDDEVAAHDRRLDQARALIRSVEVEVTIRRRTVLTTRYVRDVAMPPREQGYRNIEQVGEAALSEATVDAEIARATAVIQRGRSIAIALDSERAFIDGIRRALQ